MRVFVAVAALLPALFFGSPSPGDMGPPPPCQPSSMMGGGMGMPGGDFLAKPAQALLCKNLSEGKPENISIDGNMSPTTVHHSYRLTKTAPKEFLAEVNIRFLKGVDFDGPEKTRDALVDKYEQKLVHCLAEFSPYMKGPDGQHLTIKLNKSKDVPEHVVHIADSKFRAHSERYNSSIDCWTINHEILHVMGLVDEYKEKAKGYIVAPETGEAVFSEQNAEVPSYDCRSIGPTDSIMNNQYEAFFSTKPTEDYEFETCECSGASAFCAGYLDKNKMTVGSESHCPSGFRPGKTQLTILKGQKGLFGTPKTPDQAFIRWQTKKKIAEHPGKRDSILYPAQFRAITSPGCTDKNALYYECSKNAYKTSRDHYGGGCTSVSKTCSDVNAWLQ